MFLSGLTHKLLRRKTLNYHQGSASKKLVNFNKKYILLPIDERKTFHQQTLVAIDVITGAVYPIPIDFYSGHTNKNGARDYGRLDFDKNHDKVCIEGTIYVYRAAKDGNFCFSFKNDRFVGYHTTYMGGDRPDLD